MGLRQFLYLLVGFTIYRCLNRDRTDSCRVIFGHDTLLLETKKGKNVEKKTGF